MLPATPEAGELQQLPLELPRYLLVALREPGRHQAYDLPPLSARCSPLYAARCPRWRQRVKPWVFFFEILFEVR